MAQLAIETEFMDDFARLDKPVQRLAMGTSMLGIEARNGIR